MQICAQRPSAAEETNQLFRSSSDCAGASRPHYEEGLGKAWITLRRLSPHLGLKFERELTPDQIP